VTKTMIPHSKRPGRAPVGAIHASFRLKELMAPPKEPLVDLSSVQIQVD